jgi:broad specificity phosphatase PhoE
MKLYLARHGETDAPRGAPVHCGGMRHIAAS